jgi:hypothetical protein
MSGIFNIYYFFTFLPILTVQRYKKSNTFLEIYIYNIIMSLSKTERKSTWNCHSAFGMSHKTMAIFVTILNSLCPTVSVRGKWQAYKKI